MFKAVGLGKRKPGMSFEDFVTYYKEKHSKMGEDVMKRVGATRYARRFIQPVPDPYTGEMGESEFDVIIEFWYDNEDDFKRCFEITTGELREVFEADEENFFDRSASRLMIVVEEHESDLS